MLPTAIRNLIIDYHYSHKTYKLKQKMHDELARRSLFLYFDYMFRSIHFEYLVFFDLI